jgi:hypothetical protein
MKLAVSHDDNGDIVTLFNPDELHGDRGSLRYVPAKGEKHHVLDVPKEFETRPFQDLPKLLRVNTSGGQPRLERKA